MANESTATNTAEKVQQTQLEAAQKAFFVLITKIDEIERKLKHAIPSLLHQVSADKVRKLLEQHQNAILATDITDARMIIKSLEEIENIKQTLQKSQNTHNKQELEKLKAVPNQQVAVEFMKENIKTLMTVDKALRRIEKTVTKAHEVLNRTQQDFDKIKQHIVAKQLEKAQPSKEKVKLK